MSENSRNLSLCGYTKHFLLHSGIKFTKSEIMVVNSVHWFRKGLRLHDNPSLQEALNGADTVRCVYILDPWFAGSANFGVNRWRLVRLYTRLIKYKVASSKLRGLLPVHVRGIVS